MSDWLCTGCIVDAKLSGISMQAALNGTRDEPPTVNEAVAMLNGTSVCADHIVVQQPSALAAPDGSQILVTR